MYIEKEIGGKLRGMIFSQGTNVLAVDKAKDFDDAEKTAFGAYCLIWAALKANCTINGLPCDFTFADVCVWADQLSSETYMELIKINQEINNFKPDKEIAEISEEEKKNKKETTKKTVTD